MKNNIKLYSSHDISPKIFFYLTIYLSVQKKRIVHGIKKQTISIYNFLSIQDLDIGTYILSAEIRGQRIADTAENIKMKFKAQSGDFKIQHTDFQCVFWNESNQGKSDVYFYIIHFKKMNIFVESEKILVYDEKKFSKKKLL